MDDQSDIQTSHGVQESGHHDRLMYSLVNQLLATEAVQGGKSEFNGSREAFSDAGAANIRRLAMELAAHPHMQKFAQQSNCLMAEHPESKDVEVSSGFSSEPYDSDTTANKTGLGKLDSKTTDITVEMGRRTVTPEPESGLKNGILRLVEEDNLTELQNTLKLEGEDPDLQPLMSETSRDCMLWRRLLLYACKVDAVGCASMLLDGKGGLETVPVDVVDEDSGRTPLHYAAITGSNRCLEMLLRRKAKVDARCKRGQTPLEALLEKLRLSMSWPRTGAIAELLKLIQEEDISGVKLIVHQMKDVARFAYNLALSGSIEALAIILVVAGKLIVSTIIRKFNEQGDGTIADLLVRKALSARDNNCPEFPQEWDSASLDRHMAVKELELLLLWKPNLSRSDERLIGLGLPMGSSIISPLIKAAQATDEAVVGLLLEAGAPPNETDIDGSTALHWCLRSSNSVAVARVVWKLIEKGASVSAGNKLQATPVHVAAGQGHLEALKILLAREPSAVHAMAATRDTPLFWAVRNNHANCVRLLLYYGANRNISNLRKQRPMDLADTPDMRELLEEDSGTCEGKELVCPSLSDVAQQQLQQMADLTCGDNFTTVKSKKKKLKNGGINGGSEFSPTAGGALSSRALPPPKTELCRYYTMAGGCVRGDACFFAHGEQELVRPARSPLQELKQSATTVFDTGRSQSKRNTEDMGKKIFIGGLSPAVESEDLWNFFEDQFGPVVDAVVIGSQSGDQMFASRGFGFVTFKHEYSVAAAVKAHYVVLLGKKVEIKGAVPRPTLQSQENFGSTEAKKDLQAMLQTNNVDEEQDLSLKIAKMVFSRFEQDGLHHGENEQWNGHQHPIPIDSRDNAARLDDQSVNVAATGSSSPPMQPLPLTHGPRPGWLLKLRQWMPKFLTAVSDRLKDGEYYPLSSLKGDFRATCGMELDHVSLGYPKLSDFVRSLHDICRMKIVPVGRGPATHMVLLPPSRPSASMLGRSTPPLPQIFRPSLVDGRRSYAAAANGIQNSTTRERDDRDEDVEGSEDTGVTRNDDNSSRIQSPSNEEGGNAVDPAGSVGASPVRGPTPANSDAAATRTPSPPYISNRNRADMMSLHHGSASPNTNVDYISELLSMLHRPGSESQEAVLEAYRLFKQKVDLQEQGDDVDTSPPPRWQQQIGQSLPDLAPETPSALEHRRPQFSPLASIGESIPPTGLTAGSALESPLSGPSRAPGSALSSGRPSPALPAFSTPQSSGLSFLFDSPQSDRSESTECRFNLSSSPGSVGTPVGAINFQLDASPNFSRASTLERSPALPGGDLHQGPRGYNMWDSPPRHGPPFDGMSDQILRMHHPGINRGLGPNRIPRQDLPPNFMTPISPVPWFGPHPGQQMVRPPLNAYQGPRVLTDVPAMSAGDESICVICWERRAMWISLPCGHRTLCTVCRDVTRHRHPANVTCIVCKCNVDRWVVLH